MGRVIINMSVPLQTQVRSTAVVAYLLSQGVPFLEQIESAVLVAGGDAPAITLTLLKLVAQLLNHAETVEEPKPAMQHVFKALLVRYC